MADALTSPRVMAASRARLVLLTFFMGFPILGGLRFVLVGIFPSDRCNVRGKKSPVHIFV
jgi:hypothetical protein